jgi:selenium-binding protein 1
MSTKTSESINSEKVVSRPITYILSLLILLIFGGTSAFAEVCHSPFISYLTKPEKYLYVVAVDADAKDNDFIAVVDADLASPNYGKIINKVDLGSKGNEPHHIGFTDDRTHIWAGGLFSSRIWIIDVASDPAHPKIVKVIEDTPKITGFAAPHNFYAIPGRMLLAYTSSADGTIPGGLAEFTNDGKFIRSLPLPKDAPYMSDVRIKPEINRMITSSWTPVSNFSKPFSENDPNQFGNTLVVWDFKERKPIQVVKIDEKLPLEVRWARKPGSNYGYVNVSAGDSIWMWNQKNGSFEFKKVADAGKGCVPADLRQSVDDKYLYMSCFGTSEIQAWDISNPEKPKLHDVVIPGLHPSMMHVTYDSKRMYVTNSVLSSYDYGAENFWVRLIRIGPDGKMKMDPFFNVDFTNLPTGPARTHDMLLY